VRVEPGVTAAAIASHAPLAGSGFNLSMFIEGRPHPAPVEDQPMVFLRFVSSDYFATLAFAWRVAETSPAPTARTRRRSRS
jgi:hypothetical protein